MIFIKKVFIFIVLIIFISIFSYIIIYKQSYGFYYEKIARDKNNIYVFGSSAPRGNIYDAKGKLLVANKEIINLSFRYEKGIDYLDTAKEISKLFDFGITFDKELLFYYKSINNENKLLTFEEVKLLNERKINNSEKEKIINQRILEKDFSFEEKRIAKIYYLIKKGAVYEEKIIKENLTNEEILKVNKANIKGLAFRNGYEREYLYDDTFKTLFGSVGKITAEEKDYYLKQGYNLNDVVGISYLEKEYENYLKGQKAIYKVLDDNSLKLIKKEQKGSDLYLNIDITLQQEIEKIVIDSLKYAKTFPGTSFLNDAYVIVGDPKTSNIYAMVGKRYIKDNVYKDVLLNNINSSFVLGSTVKGASLSVGLKYNLIDPKERINDSCVKLHFVPEKCSYERLGKIDAIKALETSSNYYQFLLAIKLTGKNYTFNMDLGANEEHFNIYRSMFANYGLGVKTGIDLPNETPGLIGNKTADDLLLNLAIGQYDAYTPIQTFSYINTISQNGKRRKPSLVNYIKDNKGNIIYQNKNEVIDSVNLKDEDFDIIKQGFYNVINKGTGRGFFDYSLNAAGKTGTSETFYGKKKTINVTMAGYWPQEEPKYSIVVIVPNVVTDGSNIIHLNAKISREVSNYIAKNDK